MPKRRNFLMDNLKKPVKAGGNKPRTRTKVKSKTSKPGSVSDRFLNRRGALDNF